MKKNLYVVVDMIQGFVFEGALSDPQIHRVTPIIVDLIQHQNKEDMIFIVDAHQENALEFSSFPAHCLQGSFESEIIDDLKPFANKVIYKNSTNAFHCVDPSVYENYDQIILLGCCTDICILHYALSLKTYFNQYNIAKEVIVVEDACATFTAPHHHAIEFHDMAIALMKQAGIMIKESKEI